MQHNSYRFYLRGLDEILYLEFRGEIITCHFPTLKKATYTRGKKGEKTAIYTCR